MLTKNFPPPFRTSVTRQLRETSNGHRALVVWFTGLSGSGKSTLANAVEEKLYKSGYRTFLLDGDNLRHGLCRDLGFSYNDRRENVRRVVETSKLMVESGTIVLVALISPFRYDRDLARSLFPEGDFIEIYCSAPLETCESRDVKGLYARARAGEIKDFTGITSPYEPPILPELVVDTGTYKLETCITQVLSVVRPLLSAKA
ncbi:MAG: hypothetical protein RLZZ596_2986 [Pseudomonadota bacterium]|jgi:adenylylsulfate kinase